MPCRETQSTYWPVVLVCGVGPVGVSAADRDPVHRPAPRKGLWNWLPLHLGHPPSNRSGGSRMVLPQRLARSFPSNHTRNESFYVPKRTWPALKERSHVSFGSRICRTTHRAPSVGSIHPQRSPWFGWIPALGLALAHHRGWQLRRHSLSRGIDPKGAGYSGGNPTDCRLAVVAGGQSSTWWTVTVPPLETTYAAQLFDPGMLC